MRKLIALAILITLFSMVSYGGQWQSDSLGYRYQNDGGSWQTGWLQNTDGKWYYFDEQSGYMLTGTVTPDGYTLAGDGSWMQEIPQKKEVYNGEEYDRKTLLTVMAYSSGPGDVELLEYPVTVTVYYNTVYPNVYGGTIEILGLDTENQGAPCVRFRVNTDGGAFDLKAHCRYNLKNDKHVDSVEDIFGYCESGGYDRSHHLLWQKTASVAKKGSSLLSADICIKEGTPD